MESKPLEGDRIYVVVNRTHGFIYEIREVLKPDGAFSHHVASMGGATYFDDPRVAREVVHGLEELEKEIQEQFGPPARGFAIRECVLVRSGMKNSVEYMTSEVKRLDEAACGLVVLESSGEICFKTHKSEHGKIVCYKDDRQVLLDRATSCHEFSFTRDLID